MQYYVRELCDQRAVLIAEDGYPLSTFDTVDDAVATCIIDCRVAPLWIEWHRDASIHGSKYGSVVQGIDGDCIKQALARHCNTRPAVEFTRRVAFA